MTTTHQHKLKILELQEKQKYVESLSRLSLLIGSILIVIMVILFT